MKIFLFSLLIIFPALSFSQAPDLMSYQSVVWDGSNNLVTNQLVGFQFSILQGSTTGPSVYVETHGVTTNANGLATLQIGAGAVVSGDIASIDWSNGPYFFKTETDLTGGTTYTITGTSQFLSVPYALYANVADSVVNDMVDDADADPTNELNTAATLVGTDLQITDNGGTVTVDLSTMVDADPDPSNEIQVLSNVGNVLTLSNGGGSVTLPTSNDDDPTNELNTSATLVGTDLNITDAGGTLSVDLSSLNDNPVIEDTGGNSNICSGNTAGGAGWVQYLPNALYLDVNTSGCGFTGTPRYITSLGGAGLHYILIGATAIYTPTPVGFRVYVRYADGSPVTPADAATNGWFINWTAVGN